MRATVTMAILFRQITMPPFIYSIFNVHTKPGETKGSLSIFRGTETFFENFVMPPKVPPLLKKIMAKDVEKAQRVPLLHFSAL